VSWVAFIALLVISTPARAGDSGKSLFDRGRGLFLDERYLFALDAFDELLERSPNSGFAHDARYFRAVSLFHLGRYDDALKQIGEIRQRYRATRYLVPTLFWEGSIYSILGNHEKALERWELFLSEAGTDELTSQALLFTGLSHLRTEQRNRSRFIRSATDGSI
jgi:TolA-binding protein